MKYLIVYAHPNPQSFNHAICEAVQERLKEQNHFFEIRDLNKLNFNPILSGSDFREFKGGKIPSDIKIEQDYIRNAETLIFIYPIWWFGFPAILKGYIDRVFSYGFAYGANEKGPYGLLTDKRVFILNTTGGSKENYIKFGFQSALQTTIETGTFQFCGMQVILHQYFYGVPTATQLAREEMLSQLKKINF